MSYGLSYPDVVKKHTLRQVLEMYSHALLQKTGKTLKEHMKAKEILDDANVKNTKTVEELEKEFDFDPATGGLIKKEG